MRYENEEYILQFFEGVHEEGNRAELLEVYQKAEAFDAIMREWEDERMTKSHILETIQKYYDEYESGEYDAKK